MTRQSPDLLLFGTPEGLAAAMARLAVDAPHRAIEILVADPAQARTDLVRALQKAVAATNAPRILVVSHRISCLLGSDTKPQPEAASYDSGTVDLGLGVPVHLLLPSLAMAARLTCTRHVALLAMPEVLAHPRTQEQIRLFSARGLKVTPHSCASLSYMAYRHFESRQMPDMEALRNSILPIKADPRIDTLVMASTVVNQLQGMLEKAAFRPFYWVDSLALATARCVASMADDGVLAQDQHKRL